MQCIYYWISFLNLLDWCYFFNDFLLLFLKSMQKFFATWTTEYVQIVIKQSLRYPFLLMLRHILDYDEVSNSNPYFNT